MFMPASRTCSSAVRVASGVDFRLTTSSGVQQAPRQKTGTPLICNEKSPPAVFSASVRKPTRPSSTVTG